MPFAFINCFPGYTGQGKHNCTVPDCQRQFFTNENNKVEFIKILSEELKYHNYDVSKAKSDADTLIVSEALDTACKGGEAQLIAEDTYLSIYK